MARTPHATMVPDQFIAERLDNQIRWYGRKSRQAKKWALALGTAEVIMAAMIPFLSAMASSLPAVTTLISGLGVGIVVVTGVMGLFRFREHWTQYRSTGEALKREKILFQTGNEPYDSSDAFRLLVTRTEALMAEEVGGWIGLQQQKRSDGSAQPAPDRAGGQPVGQGRPQPMVEEEPLEEEENAA